MENSNKMNKNILILVIVLFALIASLGILFSRWQEPSLGPSSAVKGNIIALDKNISDLNGFDADLALSAQDDIVLNEVDATLNEVGEINGTTASLSNDQENLNNLAGDLASSSNDENINNEIDQSLKDVSL